MSAGAYNSVQYAAPYVTVPPDKVDASFAGKTMTMFGTVESLTATGLDAGSTVQMFRPPAGARFVGGAIWSDDLGSSVTLAVGTGATKYARATDTRDVNYADATSAIAVADKFGAATSHASATKTLLGLAANIDVIGYEFDGHTNVVVTTAGATMTTAKTITLVMEFIIK